MNKEEKISTEYDEIDLMDYVRVFLKRKWTIFGIFFGAIIIAGILSWYLPKVYKIDTLFEIGQIGEQSIENLATLKEKIVSDTYGILIREKLGITEKDYPKINIENPGGTNLMLIEIDSKEPSKAKLILDEMSNLILPAHQKKFEEQKAQIEEHLKETEAELTLLERQKVYSDQGIAQLRIIVSDLKEQINSATSTKIIKKNTISERPIGSSPVLYIVIAGVLGAFLGIFLAFFQEWWDKNKNRI
jgi:uncharacterized protein involved in exopolysaccharide biosynthesis